MGNDSSKGRVLVTGASRGIGRAVAALFSGRGYTVFGTSRDPGAIPPKDRVPGVVYLPFDLEKPGSAENLVTRTGPVDILVNNAGISQIGPAEEISAEKVLRLFQQNFFAHLRLIQLCLPAMREQGHGLVINIGSLAGRSTVPFSSIYAATKAAIEALSRGLRSELAPFGVKVAVVAPGAVNTTLPQEETFTDSSPYIDMVRKVKASRDRSLREGASPEEIAAVIGRVVDSPKPRLYYPAGKSAPRDAFLVKHLPEGIAGSVVRKRYGLGG